MLHHCFAYFHGASHGNDEARNVSAKKLPVCFATLIISPKFARTTLKQPYKILIMKKWNFGAGPSILPPEVMKATADACVDYNGLGLSLMEMSHRTKDFQAVMDEAQDLFKELLGIPEGYSVLFVGGGASLEFCMVPYNLLEKKAAYLNTGVWAKKALKEAKLFGEVVEVASSAADNFTYIPREYTIPADADYFHITTNNTIYGTELREDLDSPVPLVADMSSDIFSRPVDVSKYALIYGGAQKNLSMAGVTFVIVKDEILGKVSRPIPTMLDYRTHASKGSMFNTPPVIPYTSRNSHLLRFANAEMDQGARRREGNGAQSHRTCRTPLCRNRPQQDVPRNSLQGQPLTDEHLFRYGGRIQRP